MSENTASTVDLGIKIGTKEHAFWTDLKQKWEEGILNAQREIEINTYLIVLADKKISAEDEKIK